MAIALAGTLFFSASVEQARGRAAFALLITIAPYAILAPLIGPMLDRVRQGNKYILMGTLLARGLLCWGMAGAVQHNDTVTLLPAALGRAGAAEGLRRHQGRGDAAAAAVRDHAGLGQRPVQPGLADRHVGRRGGRARHRPRLGDDSGGAAWVLRVAR